MTLPSPFKTSGPALHSGSALNAAIGSGVTSYADTITALAGGGAAGAPVIGNHINRVSVCASDNDSVMLPTSSPGAEVIIMNTSAHSLQVFANTTSAVAAGTLDTINGTAGVTGVAVAAAKTAFFWCFTAGEWRGPVALA